MAVRAFSSVISRVGSRYQGVRRILHPRHALNLVTGVCSALYAAATFHRCDSALLFLSLTVCATTIVHHGAHVLGHGRWTDAKFVRFDVGAVSTSAVVLFLRSGQSERVLQESLLMGLVWLASFHPLHARLPLNPAISAIHLGAARMVSAANAAVCHHSPAS